jgi:hypothetical protein
MPNRKKRKTESEKARQRRRTHANLVLKYKKLIKENPTSPHRKKWQEQIEYNLNN